MTTTSLSKLPQYTSSSRLLDDYSRVRGDSEGICRPLAIEDYGMQTIVDVSPPKWHLAHTSWFFETFLLKPLQKNYREYHPQFAHLFNSYYETVGTFHPRPERGLLARPTVKEVYQYRAYIDEAMQALLADEGHATMQKLSIEPSSACIMSNNTRNYSILILNTSLPIAPYNRRIVISIIQH